MRCRKIARWLKENPGRPVDEEMLAHSARCPECQAVIEEQSRLEKDLSLLPAIEPPQYLETRIKAVVASASQHDFYPWRPRLLAPLVASLVIVAAALIIVFKKPGHRETIVRGPDQIIPSPETTAVIARPTPAPMPSPSTAIYPVWPGDGDAVESDDISIMASLYPAPAPNAKIIMTFNDREVSPSIKAEGEIISYQPGRIEPGRHQVTISLEEPGGQRRSLSYSFYALEAQS